MQVDTLNGLIKASITARLYEAIYSLKEAQHGLTCDESTLIKNVILKDLPSKANSYNHQYTQITDYNNGLQQRTTTTDYKMTPYLKGNPSLPYYPLWQ
jgi:hypothetical protein